MKRMQRLFATEREQMPPKPTDDRTRQDVEGADEDTVVQRALPAAMKPRFHRKPLRHDRHRAKAAQEPPEFADAELEQYRRALVLEPHVHQLRERVEPRPAVVHLKDRLAAG